MKNEIRVLDGLAKYVLTETEDIHGCWNDSWNTSNGYYVIHEGKQHHIYRREG